MKAPNHGALSLWEAQGLPTNWGPQKRLQDPMSLLIWTPKKGPRSFDETPILDETSVPAGL